MQNGIDKERILLEDQSKTTEENLRYSRKFLPGIITKFFVPALKIAEVDVCGMQHSTNAKQFSEYFAEMFLIRSFAKLP